MCHGMWPVGIVIGVVAVVGIAADRAVPRRRLLTLAAVPVACAVAAALTPVGPRLYPAVLPGGRPRQYFDEWKTDGLHRRRRRRSLAPDRGRAGPAWSAGDRSPRGPTSLFVGLRRRVGRSTAPAPWRSPPRCWSRSRPRSTPGGRGPSSPPGRRETGAVLACAGVLLAVLAAGRAAHAPTSHRRSLPGRAPSTTSRPARSVLNDWGQGGWMMWRWPDLDFVMHGYGDIFTDDELDRNFRLDGGGSGLGGGRAAHRGEIRPRGPGDEARLRPGDHGLDGAAPQQGPGADGRSARAGPSD